MSGGANDSSATERDPGVALRAAVAELNDLVLFGGLSAAASEQLATDVAALAQAAQTQAAQTQATQVTAEDAPGTADATPGRAEPWGAYRRRSPFAGTNNPRSPGLRMRIETEATVPTARGAVTVGPAFAGPPGFVHGGIVAGLLDEAIGWLASATVPDAAVVTGKLSVRFRSPTPVDEPLELQVVVTKHSSRSMHVNAEILANGEVTARGEALMVVRR